MYKCVTSGDDGKFSGVIDRIEQDVTTAFLCAGCNLDDQEVFDDLAKCAQDELVAFLVLTRSSIEARR